MNVDPSELVAAINKLKPHAKEELLRELGELSQPQLPNSIRYDLAHLSEERRLALIAALEEGKR